MSPQSIGYHRMDTVRLSLIAFVLTVGAFDFTNGCNDAADMVASAIASHAMKTVMAIGIVTGFIFAALFTIGSW